MECTLLGEDSFAHDNKSLSLSDTQTKLFPTNVFRFVWISSFIFQESLVGCGIFKICTFDWFVDMGQVALSFSYQLVRKHNKLCICDIGIVE